MNPTNKQEVLKQIDEAWKTAQRQLEELRTAVERTGELAHLKLQNEVGQRDLDRAFRDLGQAVWNQVKVGAMSLPRPAADAGKLVEEAERKLAAQSASITEILSEGVEVAGRIRAEKAAAKPAPSKSAVAPKGKKG